MKQAITSIQQKEIYHTTFNKLYRNKTKQNKTKYTVKYKSRRTKKEIQ